MTPEKLEEWEKRILAAIKLPYMNPSMGGFYDPSTDNKNLGNPEGSSEKTKRPERLYKEESAHTRKVSSS